MDMIEIGNLSDYEAAMMFSLLINRSIDIDPTIQQTLFPNGILQRVFDTLDTGKPQEEKGLK
jgi:hypothetical protein